MNMRAWAYTPEQQKELDEALDEFKKALSEWWLLIRFVQLGEWLLGKIVRLIDWSAGRKVR